MTHPTPCDRLDAYLGGRLVPDEEAAFETHVASCPTCLESTDSEVADALARLGAIACPPDVLDAALAQARRAAPDRSPRRGGAFRSVRVWAALAAVLAVALSLALRTGLDPDESAQVAEVRSEPTPIAPEAALLPEAPVSPEVEPVAEPPAPAPPTPPTERPAPVPEAVAPPAPRPEPTPIVVPEAGAPLPETASADSVSIAREEVYFALAIVADAQDRTASAVADGVGRLSDAINATPTLHSPQTP